MSPTKHSPTENCKLILSRLSRSSSNPFILSKSPTQTPKQKVLQKLILSYFHNVIHILSQLTENETLQLALTESAKIVPYVIGSRKAVKAYLRVSFDFGGYE